MSVAHVAALYRHPVKGLSPERIQAVRLEKDGFFPFDRVYALENGPSGFDPAHPQPLSKIRFLTLMQQAELASLDARFDPKTSRLTLARQGAILLDADLADPAGQAEITAFFEAMFAGSRRGSIRLLTAPAGHRFMDSPSGFVSILGLASVAAISNACGTSPLDPRRFRANLHLEGLAPFEEFEFLGKKLRIGTTQLEVTARIDRCAAIDVAPGGTRRSEPLVPAMERALRHHDCGIYARIVMAGEIREGDPVQIQ